MAKYTDKNRPKGYYTVNGDRRYWTGPGGQWRRAPRVQDAVSQAVPKTDKTLIPEALQDLKTGTKAGLRIARPLANRIANNLKPGLAKPPSVSKLADRVEALTNSSNSKKPPKKEESTKTTSAKNPPKDPPKPPKKPVTAEVTAAKPPVRAPEQRTTTTRPPAQPARTESKPQAKQSKNMDDNYAAWAKANKKLAEKVKPGQAGYDAIQKALGKSSGSNDSMKIDQPASKRGSTSPSSASKPVEGGSFNDRGMFDRKKRKKNNGGGSYA